MTLAVCALSGFLATQLNNFKIKTCSPLGVEAIFGVAGECCIIFVVKSDKHQKDERRFIYLI